MNMTLTHPFTSAGLGKAPFKFIAVGENAYAVGDGTTKAGGCCAYCGTGIRWEYIIESKDGHRHAVGSDCIQKVGDARLIEVVKLEKAKKAKQQRQERAERARLERLQAQRDRNGGMTDYELQEKRRKEALRQGFEAKKPLIEKLAPYARLIADEKEGFRDSIASDLRRGDIPRGKGLAITIDILAKMRGRRGSKKYEAEYARLTEFFDGLQEHVL